MPEDNHFIGHPDGGIAVKSEAAPEEIAGNRNEGEAETKPEETETPAEDDAEKTEGEE